MALDLSALEAKHTTKYGGDIDSSGRPMEIPLEDIEEDPKQPRKEFSDSAMREIIASVKLRGVKTPISIRQHPTKPGKWLLNYGARRYRASVASGKKSIPAFIDERHDDYDQVIENLQRDDLKALELALFIKKRLDLGDKKGDISKQLGKDNAMITHHLALIDAPNCIQEAYQSGRCTSPKTLYSLRGLYEKYGEAVEIWCKSVKEITRKSVTELSELLSVELDSAKFGHDQIPFPKGLTEELPDTNCDSVNRAQRLTKPELVVSYGGVEAEILLNRLPSQSGFVHLRYANGAEEEVEAERCKITLLRNKVK
ncbi:MAG: ParB/RepB/Spo0J family partition protein (plasmid) [Candidatus Symbiodolus clandestinus]